MAQLKTALTLGRGYGVRVWTFWQDLAQLRNNFPTDWESVLCNSGVVQLFGLTNGWMAKPCAELTDIPAGRLLRMRADEQVLMLLGEEPRVVRRVDYLRDAAFAGLYDANPRHEGRGRA